VIMECDAKAHICTHTHIHKCIHTHNSDGGVTIQWGFGVVIMERGAKAVSIVSSTLLPARPVISTTIR